MKKRVLAAFLAALMAAGSLAGCGSSNDGGSSGGSGESSSESSGDDIVITVATRYSSENPDEAYYRQKVEEFNALDNGITVEMDNISTEADYLDKLRTSFANGDVPNVFQEYGGSRCLDYLESDALLDLRSYLEENDSEWYNTFYDTMWGECMYEDEGYDGIYAVPFKSYFVALYYNKDLFEQAGLEPPQSVDDMLNACEVFKEMGVQPFQVGEKENYRFGHFHNNLVIKGLGVDAVDQLGNRELAYDSPELLDTYQTIADMVANGYFGENILDTDSTTENELFMQGNVAMKFDGTWFIPNNLVGSDFYDKVGVVPFPYGNEDYANCAQGGASDLLYVSKLNKSDEEIAASVEFLKYITSPEYYQGLEEVAQTVVPVKYESTGNAPENPLMDDAMEIWSGLTDLRTDVQNYDSDSQMMDTVRNALQGLAMGDTPEECAANIMEQVEENS